MGLQARHVEGLEPQVLEVELLGHRPGRHPDVGSADDHEPIALILCNVRDLHAA
jgi:hypothetical protein